MKSSLHSFTALRRGVTALRVQAADQIPNGDMDQEKNGDTGGTDICSLRACGPSASSEFMASSLETLNS